MGVKLKQISICIGVLFSLIFGIFLLLPKWILEILVNLDNKLKVVGGLGAALMFILAGVVWMGVGYGKLNKVEQNDDSADSHGVQ